MDNATFNKKVLPGITNVLNTISLFSASTVVLIVLGLVIYDRRQASRVSFRLQSAIAFTDIMRHALQYFLRVSNSPFCPMVGFLGRFFDFVYSIFNVMITLNMQLMLLNNLYPNPRWEYWYWLCPIILPSLQTLPFMVMYGDNGRGLCFKKVSLKTTAYFKVESLLYLASITLSMVYCIVIPLLILYKICYRSHSFAHLKSHVASKDIDGGSVFTRRFSHLILRNMLYPLAYFLSLIGVVVHLNGSQFFGGPYAWTDSMSLVCRSLAGTFNLLAFLFDPSLQGFVKNIAQEYRARANSTRPDLATYDGTDSLADTTTSGPGRATANPFELDDYSQKASTKVPSKRIDWQADETEALLMRYL